MAQEQKKIPQPEQERNLGHIIHALLKENSQSAGRGVTLQDGFKFFF
jgi:hypothetical protein